MQASNLSLSVQAGTSKAGVCAFFDVDGAPVAPPAAPPVWSLMDQYFNIPSDSGVVSVTPAANGLSASVQALSPGTQGIRIEAPGIPAYCVIVTVTPAPGPKPAAVLIVTFSPA